MSSDRYYRFLIRAVRFFVRPFHRVAVTGIERVPQGAVILCPNHSGLLDPFYVAIAITPRRRGYPMAKKELERVPILGRLLKKIEVIFVDRGQADVHAVKAALQVLKEDKILLIFPQGTRVKNGLDKHGEPVTPKDGASLFATRTGAPLVPVYIQEKRRLFRSVKVVFGDPYHPQTAERKATAEELAGITRDLMSRVAALGEGIG